MNTSVIRDLFSVFLLWGLAALVTTSWNTEAVTWNVPRRGPWSQTQGHDKRGPSAPLFSPVAARPGACGSMWHTCKPPKLAPRPLQPVYPLALTSGAVAFLSCAVRQPGRVLRGAPLSTMLSPCVLRTLAVCMIIGTLSSIRSSFFPRNPFAFSC